jgi:hypothetical protein
MLQPIRQQKVVRLASFVETSFSPNRSTLREPNAVFELLFRSKSMRSVA